MSLWGNKDELASAPAWLTQTTAVNLLLAASIDATADTIKSPAHGLSPADKIIYSKGAGGVDPANIADGTSYFVGNVDADQFKLYDTKANAITNTAVGRVNITGVAASGAALHTFQVVPTDIFFVDSVEAAVAGNRAKGLQTPGWYRFNSKSMFDGTLVAFTDVEITSVAGAISFANPDPDLAVGDKVTISGTVSGNEGSIAAGDYLVSATNGTGTATLTTLDGGAIVTVVATGNAKIGSVNAATTVKFDSVTFRSQAELLVAMGGDIDGAVVANTDGINGSDDAVAAGSAAVISIGTQPIQAGTDLTNSATINLAGNENLVLITAATVLPTGGTISYQWQQKLAAAGSAFTNLTAAGVVGISATTGATSTLTITTTDDLAGNQYRCVVSHAEAKSVTSTAVTATQE